MSTMNLIDALQAQIVRNEELLKQYEQIPAGAFGAVFIKKDLESAKAALANQDTVGMIRVLKSLRENN